MKYLFVNLDCADFFNLEQVGFLTYSNLKFYCDKRNLNVVLDDFGNIYIEPKTNDFSSFRPMYSRVATILKGGRYEKANY